MAVALLAGLLVSRPIPSLAQGAKDLPGDKPPATAPPGDPSPGGIPKGNPGGGAGADKSAPDLPSPNATKPILPKPRADGARPLDRVPQTAAEKARALSDLYAQLAAADSEKSAAKYEAAIERLWRISGSDTINLLIGRASKAISDKRFDLAAKLLDRAVALAPDYAEAFNQRAYLRFSQSDYRSAVGDLRRVLALDPNHFKAMEGLAQIWRESGNKKAAYGVMQQLIEVNPFAKGARKLLDELKREVEGQGI